jgi:hypothetical protein
MHVVCAALQLVAMHCSHAVFSTVPPSAVGVSTSMVPLASVRQLASTGVPLSVPPSPVLVSLSPESPVVTSARLPESSPLDVPVLELDEHPTELTLTPAPATIKATTDKANFFI